MKIKRHNAILELIKKHPINTQEELIDKLQKMGFNVTQATVSRDIKDLGLVKVIDKSTGNYKYWNGIDEKKEDDLQFITVLSTSIYSVQAVNNMVVLKCKEGLAQGICITIDNNKSFENIVGTIAGYDTIFIMARSDSSAQKLVAQFKHLISD